MRFLLAAMLTVTAVAAQGPQTVALKRFDVIRVNPEDLRRLPESMRSIFADPVPDGEPVGSLEEAAKRAGFTPRLLSGKTPERIFVTNAVSEEAKFSVAILTGILREAKAGNVTVPADWDGVVIRLQQPRGILIDYGDFYIAQASPSTISAPPGFPLAQSMEILFRAMGISADAARGLRDQFAANASAYLPIAPRFDMDIRQVPMAAGPGLLLQNADKGGELAFMWSVGDRSYFLTGLIGEEQAIAVAKSFQSEK
jgi:hypothetical protein